MHVRKLRRPLSSELQNRWLQYKQAPIYLDVLWLLAQSGERCKVKGATQYLCDHEAQTFASKHAGNIQTKLCNREHAC